MSGRDEAAFSADLSLHHRLRSAVESAMRRDGRGRLDLKSIYSALHSLRPQDFPLHLQESFSRLKGTIEGRMQQGESDYIFYRGLLRGQRVSIVNDLLALYEWSVYYRALNDREPPKPIDNSSS